VAEGCWLVDQGTGEIAGEIGPGDRIVRAKSLKLLSGTTPAPDAQFVKLFREVFFSCLVIFVTKATLPNTATGN
jgi:hypothetical protein